MEHISRIRWEVPDDHGTKLFDQSSDNNRVTFDVQQALRSSIFNPMLDIKPVPSISKKPGLYSRALLLILHLIVR
jgi:hypothetical protein